MSDQFKDFDDVSFAEQLARWTNVDRVLSAMPKHDRTKHWSMEFWGVKNECGTIGCAAGQCGLDPWFRRRGFKLVPAPLNEGQDPRDLMGGFEGFNDGHQNGTIAVESFFGSAGSASIFLNGDNRPVNQVIKEVRAYIKLLKAEHAERIADEKLDIEYERIEAIQTAAHDKADDAFYAAERKINDTREKVQDLRAEAERKFEEVCDDYDKTPSEEDAV